MEQRRVVFRTSGLVIEIEVTGSGESQRLAGRLIPAQSGVVEIRGWSGRRLAPCPVRVAGIG